MTRRGGAGLVIDTVASVGLVCVVVGVWAMDWRAGLVAAGLALLVVAAGLSRSRM